MAPPHTFPCNNESATLEHAIEDGLCRLDRLIERLEQRRGISINADLDTDDLIAEFTAQRERLLCRLDELKFAREMLPVQEPCRVRIPGKMTAYFD